MKLDFYIEGLQDNEDIAGRKNSCVLNDLQLAMYLTVVTTDIAHHASKVNYFLKYKRTISSGIYYQDDGYKIMYVNCNLYNKNIYKESQIHALVKIKISEVFEEKYYCNIYLEY